MTVEVSCQITDRHTHTHRTTTVTLAAQLSLPMQRCCDQELCCCLVMFLWLSADLSSIPEQRRPHGHLWGDRKLPQSWRKILALKSLVSTDSMVVIGILKDRTQCFMKANAFFTSLHHVFASEPATVYLYTKAEHACRWALQHTLHIMVTQLYVTSCFGLWLLAVGR